MDKVGETMTLMLDTSVDILGTKYRVFSATESEDGRMNGLNGYTDWTVKKICIEKEWHGDIGDMKAYINQVIRHEVVHAFMFESGFGDCFKHESEGQEETVVDWIAYMLYKIATAVQTIWGAVKFID